MYVLRTLSALLLVVVFSGCSLLPEQIDPTKNWSASKLYSEAKAALDQGDYETAIKYYESLEARYPFGRYAQQAALEAAYAYYKYDEPDSAIATVERFINTYPQHPHMDYAYYLKGLINFNRNSGLVERYLPHDPTQRDSAAARQSFNDFAELVKRFPNSKYAEDARQRMIYLRNNLAQYEVNVAKHYMRRDAYVAAVNRAKYVIEHYQQTPAVADALAILAEAYTKMGIQDLAADSLRVLELNYPNHPALAKLKGHAVN